MLTKAYQRELMGTAEAAVAYGAYNSGSHFVAMLWFIASIMNFIGAVHAHWREY